MIIAESIHGIAKETRFPRREGDWTEEISDRELQNPLPQAGG